MKLNFALPIVVATFSVSGSLFGQNVVLDEDFSTVPPAGWTHQQINTGTQGWISDGNGRAWHEDEYIGGVTCENRLISPTFDLTGMTEAYLHFAGETYYAAYLANHPNSYGDGISNMEISTDGGLTWTVLWTDTSQNNNDTYGPSVSLTTYLGQSNLQIGVYYFGTYAHEWWVDYVQVDDTAVAILDNWINPANQHPYYLLGETDWATAQAMAISLGGSLASVSDTAENTWIKNQVNGVDVWLGINDSETEGTSEWISGEPVLYTNWSYGDPSTGTLGQSEDFGLMYGNNGQWADFDSSRTAHAIVEISEPVLSYESLVAGQLTTISCAGLKIGSRVAFVFSPNGAGPTNTPYGVFDVDMDFISPLFWAQNGRFDFTTVIPLSMAGSTLYGQSLALNSDNTTELSNAMAVPVN